MGERLKYGEGSTQLALRLLSETDACVEWPYASNGRGYGKVWLDGALHHTHVVACSFHHGPAPSPRHEVAHSCGNRRCMNHRHLRWATHRENLADMVAMGRSTAGHRNPGAVLTEAQVMEVRRRYGAGESVAAMARDFCVGERSISNIVHRKTWAHL